MEDEQFLKAEQILSNYETIIKEIAPSLGIKPYDLKKLYIMFQNIHYHLPILFLS